MLSKQRYKYQNICAEYKIDSLPITVHLFKAKEYVLDNVHQSEKNDHEKISNSSKLGWEKYNLSTDFKIIDIDGNHSTIMTDPKNRSVLRKGMTEFLMKKAHEFFTENDCNNNNCYDSYEI